MASSWIKHVKSVAKKNKVKYGEALKQAKSSYTKGPKTGKVTFRVK